MTKKRSISLFVIFAIILVICLFACFVNFTYPLSINGNYYSYSSFIDNIKLGEDVGNSLRIVYRAELPEHEIATNYDNLKSNTIDKLKNIIQEEGYKDVTISELGTENISVQIGNILDEEDINTLKALIGNPVTISFSTNSDGSNPFAKGECIKSVTANQQQDEFGKMQYYVLIEFKDDFKSEIAEKSKENKIHIYLGENEFVSGGLSEGAITEQGFITLTNENFKSLLDANTIASQIKAGMLPLELTQISCDIVTPSYGVAAGILLSVAVIILTIAVFAYLIVKYKHMGLLAVFALLFYISIGLFLLQSIPLVHFNFAGFIAYVICFLIVVDSIITILESAKAQYLEDTKLHIAFKQAMKKNLARTLIGNGLFVFIGLVCLFMPVISVHSFGWVAFVLSIVSVFTVQALMRLFIKMYLGINNEDGKKCNFHKGGKNA